MTSAKHLRQTPQHKPKNSLFSRDSEGDSLKDTPQTRGQGDSLMQHPVLSHSELPAASLCSKLRTPLAPPKGGQVHALLRKRAARNGQRPTAHLGRGRQSAFTQAPPWLPASSRHTPVPGGRSSQCTGQGRGPGVPGPSPCPHHCFTPLCSHPPQPARALLLTSGVMDPQSWLMRVSWCCSVFPCMMGLRVHISAMMQPAPQRSMGGP